MPMGASRGDPENKPFKGKKGRSSLPAAARKAGRYLLEWAGQDRALHSEWRETRQGADAGPRTGGKEGNSGSYNHTNPRKMFYSQLREGKMTSASKEPAL